MSTIARIGIFSLMALLLYGPVWIFESSQAAGFILALGLSTLPVLVSYWKDEKNNNLHWFSLKFTLISALYLVLGLAYHKLTADLYEPIDKQFAETIMGCSLISFLGSAAAIHESTANNQKD